VKSLYYFHKKIKINKKTKKTFFMVFLGWFFYCQPCLLLLQLHRVEDAEENLKWNKNARIMSQ
jgi:hypothetical protein